ncbi:MAG: PQQ-dependent sugar dehydrogenase [Chloroflexi bacterium]|nr:PQQ-dependent sugar dehydrogenase [Chloroflexota bacterium]
MPQVSPTPDPTPTAAATPTPQASEASTTPTAEPEDFGANQAAFVQVGTGENHACAVRSDGSAVCWGSNDLGQLDLPSGVKFRAIASGWRFSCGITTEGTLACWGNNRHQQADPPDGQFTAVTAGWDHACGIGPDGATCWGREADGRAAVPAGVAFTAIGAGAEHSCGLKDNGDLACWGKNDNGRADSRVGPFRALAVGVAHTCVLRANGAALCQGQSENGGGLPPATVFDQISAGDRRTCGALATGQVECWDARPTGAPLETFGPPGAFSSLSVGWHDACAINEAGQVGCWSSHPYSFPEPYSRLLVVNAFPDIELSQPVEVIPWPYGGLAVADKRGSIAVLSSEFGRRPVLDLSDVVYSDRYEMGMLSVAVDPDFERSPFLYVYYTMLDRDDDRWFARLSRFPVADGIAVREQEFVILDVQRKTQAADHWGGAIRFGPDGMLYLGFGDSSCLECPQSLDSLHGKIIRIDVRGASGDQPYRVPDDNPQWDTPNARPEIWAYGLRNPWRMAIDAEDGSLWIGDVGWNRQEEVSIATPGANLGWPYYEGNWCRHRGSLANDINIDLKLKSAQICQYLSIYPSLTMPLITYGRDGGCAVVGGVVYRGTSIHQLNGVYLFGDYCSGRVWALDRNPEPGWRLVEIADLDRPLSSFGVDADGEVVLVTFGGALVRLVQTQLGYADSVTRKVRVTTLGAPLDPRIQPSFGDRGP